MELHQELKKDAAPSIAIISPPKSTELNRKRVEAKFQLKLDANFSCSELPLAIAKGFLLQ
jgi:hypothetical protein